jgi:hypothetical protein
VPAPLRLLVVALSAVVAGAVSGGCSAVKDYVGDTDTPVATGAPTPAGVGTLAPGFWDPSDPPPPEGTFTPSPQSWSDVRPPSGYAVTLVVDGASPDSDAETSTLRYAVQAWAARYQVSLHEVVARRAGDYVTSLQKAIDADSDLVVVVGHGLVDPLAQVSAPNLETQFLIVGAEIAEPTHNVTAVDWPGAMFRGEGLGLPAGYDPSTFTPERAADAVAAGTAAVLSGVTGFVVML